MRREMGEHRISEIMFILLHNLIRLNTNNPDTIHKVPVIIPVLITVIIQSTILQYNNESNNNVPNTTTKTNCPK